MESQPHIQDLVFGEVCPRFTGLGNRIRGRNRSEKSKDRVFESPCWTKHHWNTQPPLSKPKLNRQFTRYNYNRLSKSAVYKTLSLLRCRHERPLFALPSPPTP